jgi:parallel beta-helix repeat protein
MFLYYSGNNVIFGNDIRNNGGGMWLDSSGGNTAYHNNFENNFYHVAGPSVSMNVWDNGYPSGGNYWSDNIGADSHRGPYQNETGSDGICDAPYVVDSPGTNDSYSLMDRFKMFGVGVWNEMAYGVGVVSNSTVSDFFFNPDVGPFIRFNVTGTSGATGFSRVTIPKQLLWVEPPAQWIVLVGGVQMTPTLAEDANCTYLYFTYTHSTKTIQITGTGVVSEFPPITIMPLLTILATLAIVFAKRRTPRKPKT